MQSWHTFFWAARWSVISWLENFKAIVWSDQNFSTTLIKNMQWRAKSAKIEPFSEIFWVPHTKNSKREWFAIKFLGAVSTLYPKINANQTFSSTPFFPLSVDLKLKAFFAMKHSSRAISDGKVTSNHAFLPSILMLLLSMLGWAHQILFLNFFL